MSGLVDEGRTVEVVYLNFSNAFDPVSINIPMEKMVKYRLGERSVRWAEN